MLFLFEVTHFYPMLSIVSYVDGPGSLLFLYASGSFGIKSDFTQIITIWRILCPLLYAISFSFIKHWIIYFVNRTCIRNSLKVILKLGLISARSKWKSSLFILETGSHAVLGRVTWHADCIGNIRSFSESKRCASLVKWGLFVIKAGIWSFRIDESPRFGEGPLLFGGWIGENILSDIDFHVRGGKRWV